MACSVIGLGERAEARGVNSLSNHLRIVNAEGVRPAIYHELFGNLTVVDRELATALADLQRSRKSQRLPELLGEEVFSLLWNSYFIVSTPLEEREIIRGWLEERRTVLPNGSLIEALQISSSNLCNFACNYCFADSADQRSERRQ